MQIQLSKRLSELPTYAFAAVTERVAELKRAGIDPIDFGVGDPSEPTPTVVREAVKHSVDEHMQGGYPSYVGARRFRDAIVAWTKNRFGVALDPEREICASIGSKEAVFNFPEAFIDPGDVVLVPNPGYPPYTRGTRFAEGQVHFMNLLPENNFLPDLDAIPSDVRKRARLMWINYPNNPTGVTADRDFFERVVRFGQDNDIIIASDEAYSENYYGTPPSSILEVARDGVVVFQSLSKRSCMTGYRVGWIAGDARIVDAFKKLKTNVDSGTANFIQDAAVAALGDEAHVENLRGLYRRKRDIMARAFVEMGLPDCTPDATLYIWQRVPDGVSSVEFAQHLLDPKIAVVSTPGGWVSEETPEGNPGEGFVRFALVPSEAECETAAERIKAHLPGLMGA